MTTPSDSQKHSISQLFVGTIHALETGVFTLEEALATIDKVSQRLPGDERQQKFYEAMRELARKVNTHVQEPR